MGIIFSKGSGLNDNVFGKSIEPICAFIESKYEAFEAGSAIPKLFSEADSKNFAEKIGGMTSMSGIQPTVEGGAYPNDEMQEGYAKTIEHVTWKDKLTITREMLEDSKLLDMSKKPAGFIKAYSRVKEQFALSMYSNAYNVASAGKKSFIFRGHTFDLNSADGVAQFSKTHPSITGGATQTNLFAGPASGDAITADVIAKMETNMQNFKDDNGNPLGVTPDTILIPNDATLKKQLFSVIGADKDPATANNGFNYTFGRWNVIISPYMTGSAWCMISNSYNEDNFGALWFNRVPLTLTPAVDKDTDNLVFRGRTRFSAGFVDWRFAAMCGVTNGSTL